MQTSKLARMILRVAILGLLVLQAGCAPLEGVSDLWTPDETAPLRVGIAPHAPGLIFKDPNSGTISGLEADCATKLANRLHRQLAFVELPTEELIPALEQGKIDIIMSGMAITEMRSTRVAFSDSYLDIGQMVLLRAADTNKYHAPKDVLNSTARIGVETGTPGDLFVQRYCPAADPRFFTSADAAVEALREGKVDLLIHDAPVIWAHTGPEDSAGLTKFPTPLTCEQLAWAVPKENHRLLRQVNRALSAWKQDGSLQQLLGKWIPR